MESLYLAVIQERRWTAVMTSIPPKDGVDFIKACRASLGKPNVSSSAADIVLGEISYIGHRWSGLGGGRRTCLVYSADMP